MATATSLTAERMLEIERSSVVSARRENGDLILTTRGGTDINVGDVTGLQGPPGPDGESRYTWLKYADSPTTGMADDPTGKNYIGIAYNKTTAIESNNYADYNWTLIRGPEGQQGVPGPPGADGEQTYVWIKYAINASGTGMSNSPTGMDYIGFAYNKTTSVESNDPDDYTWALIKGPKGDKGEDGANGLPGPPGEDGLPNFTWLKYATTPTSGMSDDPTGKDYIGLSYNRGTATESTDYNDYTWSLIRGPQGNQGVPGTPGADGQPRYVWVKYANTIIGDSISDDPTGKDYIGLAYNKTTAIESNEPLDYQWSLFKGAPGADGADGRGLVSSEIGYQASWSGTLVPTGTWLTDPPALSAGQYLWTRTKNNYNASPFEVLSYSVGQMGQTGNPGADGTIITAAVVRYQLHSNGTTPPTGTWLSSPPAGSPGQWFWTRTVTSYNEGTDTIAYSVALLGQTGATGSPGTAGRGISSSTVTYQASSSGTVAPVGTWLSNPPIVSSGQYLWTRTVTLYTDASTTTAYSIGQMGAQGIQGNQGIQGPGGTSYYTWLKYADSPTTGMSDTPDGKTYIGIAHNKTTATESNTYSDYTWALIKGAQGVQGPPGADGLPTYTWIKYGTSNAGAGISDDPTGKTYIGIAYNKATIVESTNPADYLWSLIQGPAGAPGESVTGQTVHYQLSASGTAVPTGTWFTSPPVGSPGQYMWTRITFSYTSLPVSYAYSVAMLGQTGSQGIQGPPGADGQSTYTWIKYATSSVGANMSDDPSGKSYIGIAYNKTTTVESTNPADYLWSLIQNAPFIVGTQNGITGAWTGVAPFATLLDGQQITYWLPYGGSGNATLNLTLSGGGTTGPIGCYISGSDRLTTQIVAGNAVRLTYRVNANINGSSYTGWWADGDSNDRVRYLQEVLAKSTINAGQMIAGDAAGFAPLSFGYLFDITVPVLFAQSSISASSYGTDNYSAHPAVNLQNTKAGFIGLARGNAVFLKGTLQNTRFSVSEEIFTDTPLDDGNYYILLGQLYTTTSMVLYSEHPIFRFYNGQFKTLMQIASDALAMAQNALESLEGYGITIDNVTGRLALIEDDATGLPELRRNILSVQESNNGKNSVKRSSSNPGTSPGIAGDQWFKYGIGNQLIGFWIHDGKTWVETKLNSAVFGEVSADAITTGTLNANAVTISNFTPDIIEGLNDQLSEIGGTANNAWNDVSKLTNVIEIGADGIKIGAGASAGQTSFSMQLDADSLDFLEDGVMVAQVSSRKLKIRDADIATEVGTSALLAAHEIAVGGTGDLLNKVTVFRSR